MKQKLIAVGVIAAIRFAFIGGQLTGYLNRRVSAKGLDPYEVASNYGQYLHEWINDTNGRWIWQGPYMGSYFIDIFTQLLIERRCS